MRIRSEPALKPWSQGSNLPSRPRTIIAFGFDCRQEMHIRALRDTIVLASKAPHRSSARSLGRWRPPYLRRRISRICRIDTFSAGIGSPPVIIITTSREPSRPAVERSPLRGWPASNGNGRDQIGNRWGTSFRNQQHDIEVVSLLVVVILELHNLVARDRRVQPNRSMQTRISRPRTLLPLTSRRSGIRRRKIRRRVAVAALDRWRESRTARAGEA